VTWHAARFLILQALILAFAAALTFVAWSVEHRRHRLFRNWSERRWIREITGAVIVFAALFWFSTILRGVLTDGRVVAADHRLHNTLRLFHSPALHVFYSSMTNLGGITFVAPVAAALAILFWTHRRKSDARIFVVAIVGATLLTIILKYVVRRPRPPDAMAIATGPSFPSGHTLAATAVYGILIYLLLREKPRSWWQVAAVVPLIAAIAFVPMSRVYLGVHWPHDVTASLALGGAWLACLTMLIRFRRDGSVRDEPHRAIHPQLFAIVAGLAIVYGIVLSRDVQPEARPTLPPPHLVPPESLRTFPPDLRKTAEDLIGGPMEPLAFLFVGSADDVQRSFEKAGWFLADTPSVTGLAKELWAVIRDEPDPHGPATPSYFAEQPQGFTFERSGTPSGSIRKRHHIRIWRTPICLLPGCALVWGATCSYDMGIEFIPKPYLITHRIDPNIDREREFVAQTLRTAGAAEMAFLTVTGPRRGRNAGGDAFTTDGRAHVMLLIPH
jgi:membrane-associated phospholipid phosphatase